MNIIPVEGESVSRYLQRIKMHASELYSDIEKIYNLRRREISIDEMEGWMGDATMLYGYVLRQIPEIPQDILAQDLWVVRQCLLRRVGALQWKLGHSELIPVRRVHYIFGSTSAFFQGEYLCNMGYFGRRSEHKSSLLSSKSSYIFSETAEQLELDCIPTDILAEILNGSGRELDGRTQMFLPRGWAYKFAPDINSDEFI